MGQHPSHPLSPSTNLQVIGAGMPRTGTASFSAALSILRDGPVYHGGEALFLREEVHLKNWILILRHTPCRSPADERIVTAGLREQVRGYVAVTDSPPINFVGELMELFPDAKVVCTVRDQGDWWRSMEPVVRNSKMGFLEFVFFLLPTARWFTTYVRAQEEGRFGELYFRDGHQTMGRETFGYHMDYLRRVVPKEELHFFDVRDGWGPLCEILGMEVPDVPFPRVNDANAVEEVFKGMVVRGMVRWLWVFGGLTAVGAVGVTYLLGK